MTAATKPDTRATLRCPVCQSSVRSESKKPQSFSFGVKVAMSRAMFAVIRGMVGVIFECPLMADDRHANLEEMGPETAIFSTNYFGSQAIFASEDVSQTYEIFMP